MGAKNSRFTMTNQTTGGGSMQIKTDRMICNACSCSIDVLSREVHCPSSSSTSFADEQGRIHVHHKNSCWQRVSCPKCKAINTRFIYKVCSVCNWSFDRQ